MVAEPVQVIEPVDESDCFCTCPHPDCLTLGNHIVTPKFTHAAGWRAERICNSCGHEWHTHMDPQPDVAWDHPVMWCPHCGLYGEHQLQVTTLQADKPVKFKGKSTGAWSISGPDGTTVAIRRCTVCRGFWHTGDDN